MFPMNFIATLIGFRHIQYCFEPFAFFYDKEFIKGFTPIKRLLINILSILYKWIDILATKRADRVITLNQTTFKTMKIVYGVNSRISFAGIDTKHFYPHVSKEIKNMYAGKSLIIHSTDYSPVKGTDKMIRIFSQVKKEVPNSFLLITSTIANASEVTRLKNLAKSLKVEDSIKFLGFVDYNILPQLYSLSRVLVQCSYSTLSGTTSMALPVKEALACGTPAIRYPILDEDVIDGVTGFLVDPRKTSLMVKKIVEILKMDNRVYNQFSHKARVSIANKYSWDSTSRIILNEIRAVEQK
jgi:glycosyltransferase involved in cell wall biosynthesis